MANYIKYIIFFIALIANANVFAIPSLVWENGRIAGFSKIQTLGAVWDVSIIGSTLSGTYLGETPFDLIRPLPFDDDSSALTASIALASFLETTQFNQSPSVFGSCGDTLLCQLLTPTGSFDWNSYPALSATVFSDRPIQFGASYICSMYDNYNCHPANDGSENNTAAWFNSEQSYLEWTVDEPSLLALLSIGLVGIGFARRKT